MSARRKTEPQLVLGQRIYQVVLVEIDPDSSTCATSSWYVKGHVARQLRRQLKQPYDVGVLPWEAAIAAAEAGIANGAVMVNGDES